MRTKFSKLLSILLCLVMALGLLPTVALADGESGTALPAAPGMSGNVINVNAENAQYTLDGAYGPIDGKTIVFSTGDYSRLELGRATKYEGSHTDYYIGGVAQENKKTYEDFVAIKTSGKWSASAYYVRNMSNVTLKAAEDAEVNIAGLVASSGHVYGHVYDYVLDKQYESGSAYYLSQKLANITIEGIHFTAKVEFATSSENTEIDGVTFRNCTFTTGGTASDNGQGLRYYNESNNGNVKNLTVDGCTFTNCYQGIYTQKINGVKVVNSRFDTTGHNAIAIQSGDAVNHKSVVITGNTFTNIGDRIIRFGVVGADTQITIQNNTATDSGDSGGEIMKAQSLAQGITYNICANNWGEGKVAANEALKEGTAVAEVNGLKYTSLEAAIDAAEDGDTVTLLAYVAYETNGSGLFNITKSITLDGNGHKISGYGSRSGNKTTLAINFNGTEKVSVELKNLTIDNDGNKGRAVETRGNIESLKITNCKFNCTGGGNTQVLTIGGNQSTVADVTIDGGSVLSAGAAGYPIVVYNPMNLQMSDNSKLTGYCGIYFNGVDGSEGSHGSVVNATNCVFDCPNIYDGADNTFGVFALEDDDITIKLTNCRINAEATGTAQQAVFLASSWAAADRRSKYDFSIGGNSVVNATILDFNWTGNPTENHKISVTGGTFSSDPTAYVAGGYIAKKNSETEYAVIAKSGLTSGVYMSNPTGATAANHYVTKNNDGTWTVFYVAPYVAPTYSITVDRAKHGDVTVSPRNASKGTTVTLTVEPDKGYTLETITVTDKNGDEIALTNKGDGKYTFKMPAGKVYVEATFMEDNSMLNFFVDVFPGDYYYDAVLWAAKNGITGGVDDTHFAPNATCTRAQAVTFLWRAAGSPAPKSSEMPFEDVVKGSYYYDAVLWAVENGITDGTSATTFSPDAVCSRGQIVTFLWRSQKSPASDSVNPFTDVAADAYYNSAVLWAVKEDITNGTSSTTFSPDADCTRAQIVTFLWRALTE